MRSMSAFHSAQRSTPAHAPQETRYGDAGFEAHRKPVDDGRTGMLSNPQPGRHPLSGLHLLVASWMALPAPRAASVTPTSHRTSDRTDADLPRGEPPQGPQARDQLTAQEFQIAQLAADA